MKKCGAGIQNGIDPTQDDFTSPERSSPER